MSNGRTRYMWSSTLITAPPVAKLRQRIEEIKRTNLALADIDILRSRINLLLKGYTFVAPTWPQGQVVFRGRKFNEINEKPINRSNLTYPKAVNVKTFQRANRPGQPMFYCSLTKEPLFFELKSNDGEYIAISKWRFKTKMLASNVGFEEQVFNDLCSARSVPEWSGFMPSTAQCLVSKFFAKQFTMNVSIDEEYRYKISAAIAEELYLKDINLDDDAKRDGVQFGGLHYPSIAMHANSDNLALFPHFVDNYLDFVSVDWVRIDAQKPDFTYDITYLDFANSFSADDFIEWKGRRSHCKLRPGEMVKISVENGQLVSRDMNGNLKNLE